MADKIEGTSGYKYLGKRPIRLQTAFWFNEAGKIHRFTHKIDQKSFDLLKATWGEPAELVDGSDKSFRWYDPEAKIMVSAEPKSFDRANPTSGADETIEGYNLSWTRYTPLDDILGANGLVTKAIIGKTAAELRAMVPELIEETSAADAKAKLDAVGLDANTQAKAEALGAAEAKVTLNLPPTETNEHFVLVQPTFEGGKVTFYSFFLTHDGKADIKDEILAQIGALLGKPTATKKERDEPEYTFAGPGGTVIRVKPSMLDDAWMVSVAAK